MATAETLRFMSVFRPMPSIKIKCSMRLGSTCSTCQRKKKMQVKQNADKKHHRRWMGWA
jgi:hypothetical protein